jgi:hypothetical protein
MKWTSLEWATSVFRARMAIMESAGGWSSLVAEGKTLLTCRTRKLRIGCRPGRHCLVFRI